MESNVERNRARARQWAIDHPDEVRDRLAAWRAANPDKVKEYRARAYQKAKASGKTIEQSKRNNEKRRRQKKGNVVSLKAILERDGMVCHICGLEISDRKFVAYDHVVPLSRGGTHTEDNLKVAHRSCNSWKHDRLMEELEGLPPVHDDSLDERLAALRRKRQSEATRRWWNDPANAEVIAARNRKVSEARKGRHLGFAFGNPGSIRKGWGNGFAVCQECGTSDRPHKSKGLCNACYLRTYRAALPEDVRRRQVHGR